MDTFFFELEKLFSRFIKICSSAYVSNEFDIWKKLLPIITRTAIKNKMSIVWLYKLGAKIDEMILKGAG